MEVGATLPVLPAGLIPGAQQAQVPGPEKAASLQGASAATPQAAALSAPATFTPAPFTPAPLNPAPFTPAPPIRPTIEDKIDIDLALMALRNEG